MWLRTVVVLAIGAFAWWRQRGAWHEDSRRSVPPARANVETIDPGAIIRPKHNVDPKLIVRVDPGIDPGSVVVPRPQLPQVRRSRS